MLRTENVRHAANVGIQQRCSGGTGGRLVGGVSSPEGGGGGCHFSGITATSSATDGKLFPYATL